MGSATSLVMALSYIRKQGETTVESKLFTSISQWLLLHILPLCSCPALLRWGCTFEKENSGRGRSLWEEIERCKCYKHSTCACKIWQHLKLKFKKRVMLPELAHFFILAFLFFPNISHLFTYQCLKHLFTFITSHFFVKNIWNLFLEFHACV